MDPSCRILTISATIDGAETFIEQIKNISTTSPSPTDASTAIVLQAVSSDVAALVHIPWTITNRYYTADVHFTLLRMEAVTSSIFLAGMNRRPPPAIVYVWREGEAYSDHIAELSRIMASESYEPEVSLAVRIPAPKSDAEPSTSLARKNDDAEDDATNGDIDNTLMSYGFEYIDGTQSLEASTSTSGAESLDDVPGLPRVLDALSTIMWPSMKSAAKGGSSSSKGLLDEKSRREHDDIMEELLSQGRDASFSSTQSDSETKEREAKESEDEDADLLAQMHAFVRKGNGTVPSVGVDGTPFSPYDFNNTEGKQRPWINTTSSVSAGAEIAMSPTDIDATTPFGSRGPSAAGDANSEEKTKQVSLGFEDDFTVFVSAPPVQKPRALNLGDAAFGAGDIDGPDIPTPTATGAVTADGLGLAPDSARRSAYRSLGSVSDFGGSDDGREHEASYEALGDDDGDEWEDVDSDDDDEDEEGLPSKEEVREAAARIFGPGLGGVGVEASSSSNPSGGAAGASASASDSGPPAAMLERMGMLGRMAVQQDIMTGMAAMRARSGAAAGASVSENTGFDPDAGDEDDGDGGPVTRPFDLEKVFGALQQYKSEIAGMANEEERRKAAAKVALGLVYGLEGGKP